jgi:hypothetical protein
MPRVAPWGTVLGDGATAEGTDYVQLHQPDSQLRVFPAQHRKRHEPQRHERRQGTERTVRLTYAKWRKLASDLFGSIATCDDPYGHGCVFGRRYILLCDEHASNLRS